MSSDSTIIFSDSTTYHSNDSSMFILKNLGDHSHLINIDSSIRATWRIDTLAFYAADSAGKPVYTNLYHGHFLHPANDHPLAKTGTSPDWFFPILLLVLSIYAALRIFYTKYFSQMVLAFVNNNLTNQIVRDENILVQRTSTYLSLVFNLIAALFLYLISLHYGWNLGGVGTGFNRFLFFAVLISFVYALKFLVLKISGRLFNLEREMATYIFNTFLINNILGIVLLPFIFLMAYNQVVSTQWFIVLGLSIVALAFGYRIFRGILIGLSTSTFSLLYLFLYLCTLEIAPLMILIRIMWS